VSVTGQVGHIAVAKQSAFGTPNVTAANYRLVEITGDSLAAANNMLAADGEIGAGRDITSIVPGGFTSAGAVNGNLRARSAGVFLDGALGTTTAVGVGTGPPATVAYTSYTPADTQPYYSIEKRVGTSAAHLSELMVLQYSDCIVNTLNIAANSGALSTFSAGLMTAGESTSQTLIVDDTATGQPYSLAAISNDLLVFHGGRIMIADSGGATSTLARNDQFQSLEVVINNNVQGDEWTIRPSRFLHSFTEGIRNVELNMTIVFDDIALYQQYTYGSVSTLPATPGYHLYSGMFDFSLCNWQLTDVTPSDPLEFAYTTGNGAGANPQAVHFYLPNVVFAGLPVTLATGRIVVTTNGRAVKPLGSSVPIIEADVLPHTAAF